MNRKNILALIALLAVLVMALTGCGSDDADRIAQLEAENARLQSQVDTMAAQLEELGQTAGLASFTLNGTAWSSNNGANVTLTAVPLHYAEGQTAAFSIWLEGEEIDNVPCDWDGEKYTASTDLNAADGYCYYVVLTTSSGAQTEIEINTPKTPTESTLVYMESSLESYCNMMVESSKLDGSKLTITGGYVQVQLPLITASGEAATYAGAELILSYEGQDVATQALTLPAGESPNSYEMELNNISFDIPAMEDDQQLELRLEVTLSNGQTMTTPGGCWYYNGGDLLLVVG